MLHPTHEEYTKLFFEQTPKALEKLEAIPLILLGQGVGEGHAANGAFVLLNSQGRTDLEMLQLLKHVVEQMEKAYQ